MTKNFRELRAQIDADPERRARVEALQRSWMTTKYDWRSVLTGHVEWRILYRNMRIANPQASRLQCLWWTIRWPHVHSEDEFEP